MPLQVEHDFILQAERETFIEQMKDVMDKAEDMLSEDTDVDRGSDPGVSPPHVSTCGLGAGEVSPRACSPPPPSSERGAGPPPAACWRSPRAERCRVGQPGGRAPSVLLETSKPQAPGCFEATLCSKGCPRSMQSADFRSFNSIRRAASPRPMPRCINRTVRLPLGRGLPITGPSLSSGSRSLRAHGAFCKASGRHTGGAAACGEHPPIWGCRPV